MTKYLLSLLGAVLLCGAVLFGASATGCLTPAKAQTAPSEEVLTEQKARQLRAWLDKTKADDFAKRERWRGIFSRAMPKAMPSATPYLLRAGLPVAAGAVWLNNFDMLFNYAKDGVIDSSFAVSSQFQAAPGAVVGYGRDENGTINLRCQVTRASIRPFEAGYETIYTVVCGASGVYEEYGDYKYYGPRIYSGTQKVGSRGQQWSSDQFTEPSGTGELASYNYDLPGHTMVEFEESMVTRDTESKSLHWCNYDFGNSACETWETIPLPSDAQSGEGDTTIYNYPSYSTGAQETKPPSEYEPAEGDSYEVSPEEGGALYDAVKADPEYDPATDDIDDKPVTAIPPEVERLAQENGGLVSTRENADGSTTYRFGNGTEYTTWPDGTNLTRRADGTEEWNYPDGTRRTWDPRTGKETTYWPDGTTRHRYYPDGTSSSEIPQTTPQSEEWIDPNGEPTPAPSPDSYPEPDTPTAPSPGTPTNPNGDPQAGCQSPRKSSFELPEMDIQDKFPFSLILWLKQSFESLAGAPSETAPTLNLPFGDKSFSWSFTEMQGTVSLLRNLVWFFGSVFLVVGFYILIKGGSKTE